LVDYAEKNVTLCLSVCCDAGHPQLHSGVDMWPPLTTAREAATLSNMPPNIKNMAVILKILPKLQTLFQPEKKSGKSL